jgi:ATP-dependent RNA helicase DeaD
MGKDGLAYMFVCPDQGEPLTAIENLINKTIPPLPLEGFEAYRREPRRDNQFKELYSTAATRSPFGSVRSAERA